MDFQELINIQEHNKKNGVNSDWSWTPVQDGGGEARQGAGGDAGQEGGGEAGRGGGGEAGQCEERGYGGRFDSRKDKKNTAFDG